MATSNVCAEEPYRVDGTSAVPVKFCVPATAEVTVTLPEIAFLA